MAKEEMFQAACAVVNSVDALIGKLGYLPKREALRLDDVIRTVTREFPSWGAALEEEYRPWIEGKGSNGPATDATE